MVSSGAVLVVERDLAPGQVADSVEQAGMVGLDLGDVVGATGADVAAVGVLGMQRIGGDDRAGQVDAVQQGLEGWDFVALVGDPALGQDVTGVVHRGEQGDVGAVRTARKAPIAWFRVSPASWTRRRRRGMGCGTDTVPVSGSRGAWPVRAGASVIHSVIAVSYRAPAGTLAAAAVTRADPAAAANASRIGYQAQEAGQSDRVRQWGRRGPWVSWSSAEGKMWQARTRQVLMGLRHLHRRDRAWAVSPSARTGMSEAH